MSCIVLCMAVGHIHLQSVVSTSFSLTSSIHLLCCKADNVFVLLAENCLWEWGDYSPCSHTCGEEGTKMRSPIVTRPAECGGGCDLPLAQTERCNTHIKCPGNANCFNWLGKGEQIYLVVQLEKV